MHSNSFGKIVLLFLLIFLTALPGVICAAPIKGKNLPVFEAKTVDGKTVSQATFAGKVVLLSVTNDECDACKKGIPRFNELTKKYEKQGFQMLGLHYGKKLGIDDLKTLIKDYNVGFPMALIEEKVVKNTLGIFGVPCYVLLDKKGTIAGIYRYRSFNDSNFKIIETQIKTSLSE
jgi:peroxiredoxin